MRDRAGDLAARRLEDLGLAADGHARIEAAHAERERKIVSATDGGRHAPGRVSESLEPRCDFVRTDSQVRKPEPPVLTGGRFRRDVRLGLTRGDLRAGHHAALRIADPPADARRVDRFLSACAARRRGRAHNENRDRRDEYPTHDPSRAFPLMNSSSWRAARWYARARERLGPEKRQALGGGAEGGRSTVNGDEGTTPAAADSGWSVRSLNGATMGAVGPVIVRNTISDESAQPEHERAPCAGFCGSCALSL